MFSFGTQFALYKVGGDENEMPVFRGSFG